jgi:plastocyanin
MPNPRATFAATALCAAGLVLAAGCGGGGSGSASSDSVTIKAPAGGGTPTLTIEAHDVFFTPKQVKAPSGKLNIDYVEKGSQQHTLVIDGVKDFKLDVGPGKRSANGTIDLAPGEYSYYCTIPGHRAQGMSGTITVAS